jgi:hypothetical protein
MTTANIIKRDLLVQVFLLAAIFHALWLTACNEEAEGVIKTITLSDIPAAVEISSLAKDQLSEYDNLSKLFFQEAGKWYIKTEGLYVMSLFLPVSSDDEWYDRIQEKQDLDGDMVEEMLDEGSAFALMKINGNTIESRILTLSSDVGQLGYYWDSDDEGMLYGICNILMTADARFIIRTDFSLHKYARALYKYWLSYDFTYESNFWKITVFTVVRKKGTTDSFSNKACTFMPDSFLEYLWDRYS